jgi:peptidoglycan/xylan/chitin deacetylase (PgdA/CDA1 family)
MPLDDAVAGLRAGQLPAAAAAITFDDGYADNHLLALPILRRHGLCATFFVATGFLDGGRMWNDTLIESVRRWRGEALDPADLGLPNIDVLQLGNVTAKRAAIDRLLMLVKYLPASKRQQVVGLMEHQCGAVLPVDLMMRSEQVRSLRRAGMQIGAHTVTHPILALTDEAGARAEISGSRAALESLLGERVGLFAYPNGKPGEDYTPRDVGIVRELGFDAAVSTAWGVTDAYADPFQMRRFTPWDRHPLKYAWRLAMNYRIREPRRQPSVLKGVA